MKRCLKNFRKACFKDSCFIIAVLLLIIYCIFEVYIYSASACSFQEIQCKDDNICTKILFVADPQLIGLHNEIVHPITVFSIFDIDRYLHKTYLEAFNFVKPDVVIFLGDLFDEGSTATDSEFQKYFRRFQRIYDVRSYDVKQIFIPGDNDIGGEGADFVTEHKARRFQETFKQEDVVQVKSLTFYKINRLTNKFVTAKPDELLLKNNKNIGLSHIPLLQHYSSYAEQMLSVIKPQVLFSAHEHSARIIDKDNTLGTKRTTHLTPAKSEVYEFFLSNEKTYEILVPTASYRMGTSNIGHGFAVIENDKLRYTVLWSPKRFPQLILYAVLALCMMFYAIYAFCARFLRRRRRRYVSMV